MVSSAVPSEAEYTSSARNQEPGSLLRLTDPAGEVAREFRVEFVHGGKAAPIRRSVERVLREWGLSQRSEDVLLVTTELVQNVTRHTADGGELRVVLRDEILRVEVADTDPRPPMLQRPDLRGPGGRGLLIVAAVAHRWGYRPAPGAQRPGKVTWAEFQL
ncbi:ATP-binding protein [Paractinoplanes maris]|uniref:ATP-binding protein n=1 Tax=Paractinoplanes maris TaxID=1734446 RepID=UPI0020203436|nr:ATP-binding protein [Actinoplanes maris]